MDAKTPPRLAVENMTVGYEGEAILENVSFEVERGEIFVLAGLSGCGKTTLLKSILGLVPPLSGNAFVDGERITGAEGRDRQRVLNRIGVLFQGGALWSSMTLLENVRLPLEAHTNLPDRAIEVTALSKLQLMGIAQAALKMPAEVSGGMHKRAALARAMALDAEILLLDEPTTGLDPIISGEMDQLINWLADALGITSFIISHELSTIFSVADRVAVLEQHGIAAIGPPSDLREHSESEWVRRFLNPDIIQSGDKPGAPTDDHEGPAGGRE
jgi:phospholipid/cholesterol/gamma-HCH transport system ATP-binding protein